MSVLLDKFEEFRKDVINSDHNNVLEDNYEIIKSVGDFYNYEEKFSILKGKTGIDIPKADWESLATSGLTLDWDRPAESYEEAYMYGGYVIQDLTMCLGYDDPFWKIDHPSPSDEERLFLEKINYIQRCAHGNDGTYGCLYREQGVYPCPVYFYDKGLYCKMNLDYDQYYESMLASSAVSYWQYFYIDIDEIYSRTRDINADNINSVYHDEIPEGITKFEAIINHLESNLKLLPDSFPDKDFSYHQKHLEELKSKQ